MKHVNDADGNSLLNNIIEEEILNDISRFNMDWGF